MKDIAASIRQQLLNRARSDNRPFDELLQFGDVVFPEPTVVEPPSILGLDHFAMLGYSRESVIAEKVDAMVRRGLLNSRMKDFHDMWLLSQRFNYSGSVLREAMTRTLKTRGTNIPPRPAAFTPQFVEEKQEQWQAYLRRMNETAAPSDFRLIMAQVRAFVEPVLHSIDSSASFDSNWDAPGPWRNW